MYRLIHWFHQMEFCMQNWRATREIYMHFNRNEMQAVVGSLQNGLCDGAVARGQDVPSLRHINRREVIASFWQPALRSMSAKITFFFSLQFCCPRTPGGVSVAPATSSIWLLFRSSEMRHIIATQTTEVTLRGRRRVAAICSSAFWDGVQNGGQLFLHQNL